jgi:hypothetical protein
MARAELVFSRRLIYFYEIFRPPPNASLRNFRYGLIYYDFISRSYLVYGVRRTARVCLQYSAEGG